MNSNYDLIKSTYKNKSVLITGHTGFKGSWLSLWLNLLGANVTGYALKPPTKPSMFKALNLDENIQSITGDVREVQHLKNVFNKYKPEIVFHLAAQSLVRHSYKEPKYTYETNVIGTVNLLESVRNTSSVKVVVIVTSDKCYKNREWVWGYRESDPMGGSNPYSSSKGCAELVTTAYRNSFFNHRDDKQDITLASARAGNAIGGGDWADDRLLPDCVKALSKGKQIKVRNPQAIRPWQCVLEPLRGYLILGAKMYTSGSKYEGAWNFGPKNEDAITVQELVQKTIKYWGNGSWDSVSPNSTESLHEATFLKLDCSKANHILSWKPILSIEDALEFTVEWYKKYYSKEPDMKQYTKKKIKEYINSIN